VRRVMYAQEVRRVMYAQEVRRVMYAQEVRRVMYAQEVRRVMYAQEVCSNVHFGMIFVAVDGGCIQMASSTNHGEPFFCYLDVFDPRLNPFLEFNGQLLCAKVKIYPR
jgi:hypothetical protein